MIVSYDVNILIYFMAIMYCIFQFFFFFYTVSWNRAKYIYIVFRGYHFHAIDRHETEKKLSFYKLCPISRKFECVFFN